MKKFWLQIAALLIITIIGMLISVNGDLIKKLLPANNPIISGDIKKVQIIDPNQPDVIKVEINTEVSDSKEERAVGLGGRASLASNSGMLFIYEQESRYTFWMKGLTFPLDFMWIRGDTILELLTDVQPPLLGTPDSALLLFSPSVPVDRVLEVNAGVVNAHGIKPGDKLIYIK